MDQKRFLTIPAQVRGSIFVIFNFLENDDFFLEYYVESSDFLIA